MRNAGRSLMQCDITRLDAGIDLSSIPALCALRPTNQNTRQRSIIVRAALLNAWEAECDGRGETRRHCVLFLLFMLSQLQKL